MPVSLAEIVENKKLELKRKQERGVVSRARTQPISDNAFVRALTGSAEGSERPNLICELKPRSPSAGELKDVKNWRQIVAAYRKYASALSILTDEKYFGGSLELLRQIDQFVDMPLLRKDFIIDESQCFEALEYGADAVLLIVKILEQEQLAHLHAIVHSLGMAPVVEVQNEQELERALLLSPLVLLINNRDLSTFEVDFKTTERLAPAIPKGIVKISASGIGSRADIDRLLPYCSNFLIGSALMRTTNIERLLTALLGACEEEEKGKEGAR